jgi:WhiB family transcriptional regulator, redox-sensing transcriptional regulator
MVSKEWTVWRLFDPMDWAVEAACNSAPVDWFFPEVGKNSREAKKVCATCPVIEDCLYYALEHSEIWGIWGGMTYKERRSFARTIKEDVA